MKPMKLISCAGIVVSLVLAVVSYCLLPETVVTQIVTHGEPSHMPRLLAVLLPTLLGVGGSVAALSSKGDTRTCVKCLVVAGAGLLVFVLTLVINL